MDSLPAVVEIGMAVGLALIAAIELLILVNDKRTQTEAQGRR